MSNTTLAVYTQGHDEAIVRSHTSRTAANSAAYLLPYIQSHHHILDVGCGPGTITTDLATLVSSGSIIGIDLSDDIIAQAQALASSKSLLNCSFQTADIYHLPFEDGTFDIVHAHQVTSHLSDPVGALKEMKRVCKAGGIVADREADLDSLILHPRIQRCYDSFRVLGKMSEDSGGCSSGGRHVHVWAREAGFDKTNLINRAGNLCYTGDEERRWWAGVWIDRLEKTSWGAKAVKEGYASNEEVKMMADGWREWGECEDGWFNLVVSDPSGNGLAEDVRWLI